MNGDALAVDADVLALKYAQAFHGVDRKVSQKLAQVGIVEISPKPGNFSLVSGNVAVSAHRVLFVGVRDLYGFGYKEIREFSIRVMSLLNTEATPTRTLALTLHGPGYGLDERECFLSELAGIADAVSSGDYPTSLEEIKVVEADPSRAQRLRTLLDACFPDGALYPAPAMHRHARGSVDTGTLRSVGYDSGQKPHIFVAMPFADHLSDLFHYGIQPAVGSVGHLCERIDQVPAVGDILARIKNRIKSASFVVAELTGANPNVYLEVGYAWGCGIPTILLIHKEAIDGLKFDVVGQRCVSYSSIMDLEGKLSYELKSLTGRA